MDYSKVVPHFGTSESLSVSLTHVELTTTTTTNRSLEETHTHLAQFRSMWCSLSSINTGLLIVLGKLYGETMDIFEGKKKRKDNEVMKHYGVWVWRTTEQRGLIPNMSAQVPTYAKPYSLVKNFWLLRCNWAYDVLITKWLAMIWTIL